MFSVATIAVLIAMALALVRAFLGPTVYDRILAVNVVGTKTVLLIAALGFLAGRPDHAQDRVEGLISRRPGQRGIRLREIDQMPPAGDRLGILVALDQAGEPVAPRQPDRAGEGRVGLPAPARPRRQHEQAMAQGPFPFPTITRILHPALSPRPV